MDMSYKHWGAERENLLEESWGKYKLETIAAKVGKSEGAVSRKAYKMKLGRYIDNMDGIVINSLIDALGLNSSTGELYGLFEKKKLPYTTKLIGRKKVKVIEIDKFWEWAEKNKRYISFRNFERNMLGEEPDWVEEKRNVDIKNATYNLGKNWPVRDENLLKSLIQQNNLTLKQISKRLMRTEFSIVNKIKRLGLDKDKIKKDPKKDWQKEEREYVMSMYKKGYIPDVISESMDRSARSIDSEIKRIKKGNRNG